MPVHLLLTTAESPDLDDEGDPLPIGTVVNRILWDGETECDFGPYEVVPKE